MVADSLKSRRLLLRRRRRRRCRSTGACWARGRLERYGRSDWSRCSRRRRRARYGRRAAESVFENRPRHASAGRHDLHHEGQAEEDPATPPRGFRQDCTCLTDSNERIRGGAGAAKIGREPASLPSLQQDRCDQDDCVEYKKYEENVVEHVSS